MLKPPHLIVYRSVPLSTRRSSLFGVVMLWATDFFPLWKKVSGVQILLARRLFRGKTCMGPSNFSLSSLQLWRKKTSMVYSWGKHMQRTGHERWCPLLTPHRLFLYFEMRGNQWGNMCALAKRITSKHSPSIIYCIFKMTHDHHIVTSPTMLFMLLFILQRASADRGANETQLKKNLVKHLFHVLLIYSKVCLLLPKHKV